MPSASRYVGFRGLQVMYTLPPIFSTLSIHVLRYAIDDVRNLELFDGIVTGLGLSPCKIPPNPIRDVVSDR